jgi:hypothetical protein
MEDVIWLLAFFIAIRVVPKVVKGIREGIRQGIDMVGRAIGWGVAGLILIFVIKTLFI